MGAKEEPERVELDADTMPDLRERILATAGDLFARRGYKATTFREIADALGITKGAITYHFKNKHLIVDELFQRYFDVLRAHIDAFPEAYLDQYWRFGTMYILAYRAILSSPIVNDLFHARDQQELWSVTKAATIRGIYRDIAHDFHKVFSEEELSVTASFDWSGRLSLYRAFTTPGGHMSPDRFCRYNMYHMGLLARLDEATIARDIAAAFAFADAHKAPGIPMMERAMVEAASAAARKSEGAVR